MFKRKFGSDLTYRFDGKQTRDPELARKKKKQPRVIDGWIDRLI